MCSGFPKQLSLCLTRSSTNLITVQIKHDSNTIKLPTRIMFDNCALCCKNVAVVYIVINIVLPWIISPQLHSKHITQQGESGDRQPNILHCTDRNLQDSWDQESLHCYNIQTCTGHYKFPFNVTQFTSHVTAIYFPPCRNYLSWTKFEATRRSSLAWSNFTPHNTHFVYAWDVQCQQPWVWTWYKCWHTQLHVHTPD